MKKIVILFLILLEFIQAKELKIIALDWTMAETMMMLNYQPLAVGDKRIYNTWVKEPALPNEIKDVGLRVQPNIEYIINLKPDLIITSSLFNVDNHILKNKVKIIDFYQNKKDVYSSINEGVLQIGMILNKKQEALDFIQNTRLFFETFKKKLHYTKPIAIVQFIDKKHLRIYTKHSLFGAVLEQLGLKNVYNKNINNAWGVDIISFLDLLKFPKETKFIVIKPTPFVLDEELKQNPFYQKMNIFQDYNELEPIWSAGSLMSMKRFAKDLIGVIE
ncbi:TPA: ABC transporter substrate-binding protein [Campylobacter jejuni]|nr:ABC transporter substrate-binding protein [Campylobacter jejuni]HDZ5083286.1 ABC transporter substrate-binding protein [Campylobacter jejuni]HDZ5085020.1 ABC transporter substrate-binding protein [Campylobacter jejuni]HDZ5086773.1 ABC transporter substrate-binding protein [Campylobacter jejuni]HDZ5089790.1 ABC transporter substrate-binding protein [Campylobacter jejuni]